MEPRALVLDNKGVDTIVDIRAREQAAGGTKPSRLPRRKVAGLAVLALAAGLVATAAPARADLTPALSTQLLQTPPEQTLTVIVSLAAQIDPALYAGDPVGLAAAQHALADLTQKAVVDAAGVPVVSFWSVNAVALTASAQTIQALAAMPGVARVDLDPMAQTAPIQGTPGVPQVRLQTAAQVSPTLASRPVVRQMTITVPSAPLRVLEVVQRGGPGDRSLLVRVMLDRPGTVRAELRTGTRRIAGASVRRLSAGRFSMVVRVPPFGSGPLRLNVSRQGPAGHRIGPAVERPVSLTA
jgi:hypothetical protein